MADSGDEWDVVEDVVKEGGKAVFEEAKRVDLDLVEGGYHGAQAVYDGGKAIGDLVTGDTTSAAADVAEGLTHAFEAVPGSTVAWDTMALAARASGDSPESAPMWDKGGDKVFQEAWAKALSPVEPAPPPSWQNPEKDPNQDIPDPEPVDTSVAPSVQLLPEQVITSSEAQDATSGPEPAELNQLSTESAYGADSSGAGALYGATSDQSDDSSSF